MEIIPASASFVMQNFQEFYREVLIQKEYAYLTLDPQSQGEPAEQIIFETVTDKIQRKLREMLERFSLNAQNQIGEFAVSHFQEALYIMVALADEIFLSFEWPGQKRWEDNLLEAQLFHTQIAGELFYNKLDALLEANDPMRNDIAIIYLLSLALGFKGKYRGEDDSGKITWYREQLYAIVNRRSIDLFHPGREHLVPSTYEHVVIASPGKGLPDLRTWFIAFASIVTVFVFVSSVMWYKVVRDMDEAIGQILKQAQQLGLS